MLCENLISSAQNPADIKVILDLLCVIPNYHLTFG